MDPRRHTNLLVMDTFRSTFERTLHPSDSKQNIHFSTGVPSGTTQFHIRFTFSPWVVDAINNMLTLSVFDPAGFRGAGHRHGDEHQVLINAVSASSGYLAGPIPPGEWSVVVDTHMIHGGPCSIRLEVWGTDDIAAGQPAHHSPGHTAPRGRGWYRGDLHAHTIHSDAKWDIPDLLAWARRNRLDFCTLSDHNTITGLAQMDAARSDGLLTMGGMELTTFWGHALALGSRAWSDWRTRDGHTMPLIAARVMESGSTFIIAHPRSIGDPYCTGCRWVYPHMMPGNARVVEAWNGVWGERGSRNQEALPLIYAWLNEGHRLALTSGTDNHGSEREQSAAFGFNVVYAEELAEPEILRAIRAGHSYLSAGPCLELSASAGDRSAMMGDILSAAPGEAIHVTAHWQDSVESAQLSLIVDGKARDTKTVGASGARSWELASGQDHWCLLTLGDGNGGMLALTNPIYLDDRYIK